MHTEVIKACVSLCCIDINCSGTATGYGFVDYSHSLKQTGSLHGSGNVKGLLLTPFNTHNTQNQAEKLSKPPSSVFSHKLTTM
jgi:hypothetical protein